MRPLGTVIHALPRDTIVVRGHAAAGPGTKVVDRDGRPIGVVDDVIGPVTRPYLVVRGRGRLDRLVGVTLYSR